MQCILSCPIELDTNGSLSSSSKAYRPLDCSRITAYSFEAPIDHDFGRIGDDAGCYPYRVGSLQDYI